MNMQNHPIRVLLIDDDEKDYIVVRGLLSDLSSMEFILEWVSDYGAALDAILSSEFDVCLLDYRLKERNGLEFMQEALSRGAVTPIVFLTGQGCYDPDLEAISKGAVDWLTKGELSASLLERSIRFAMERQRKRDELIKAKRVIQALSECNHAVIRIKDETELLRAICRIVVDVGGFRMAWVGYAEEDRDQTVTPVAQYGYDKDYLETVKVTWKDAERGRGPTGTSIRRGIPTIIRSVGNQAEFAPWRAEALKRGYASVIGLPLFLDGRRLGALTIYSSETDAFDTEEAEFLVKLSSNLSYGIGVLRLRKARMQAEESLKEAYLDLERLVEERTAELVEVNTELRREAEERKRTEEALKEGERKFRAIFDQTFQFMGVLSIDGRLIEANRTALQFIGVQESDVIGKPFWETPWWRHSAELQEMLRVAVKTAVAGELVRFEASHPSADGSLHCMDFSLKPVMDEAGGIVFLIAEARDINKRKQAEEALRKSEARLSLAMNQAGMGTWDVDWLTGKAVWSESFFRLLGYELRPDGEAHIEMWWSRLHPEDRVRVSQECERARVDHSSEYMREYRVIRADTNEVVWLSGFARFLYDENGEAVRHTGIVFDSTRRKLMEEEISQTNAYLENIFDNSPDAISITDNHGRFIRWNKMAEDLVGGTFEEMKGKSAFDLYADKDDLEKMLMSLRREGLVKKWEMRIKRKDGRIVPFEISIALLKDSENRSLGSVTVARDLSGIKETLIALSASNDQLNREIIERKRSEKALRESEERYKVLFDGSTHGILAADFETKRLVSANPSICHMLGYTGNELLDLSIEDIHPKDSLNRVLSELESQLTGEKKLSSTLPCLRKDGTVFFADITNTLTSIHESKLIVGFFSDVTERRMAQEQIESIARFPDEDPNPILRISSDGKLLYANRSSSGFLKSLGWKLGETLPGDWRQLMLQTLSSGCSEEMELACEEVVYSLMLAPVSDLGYLNIYGLDITVRKRMEEELRRSNIELDLTIQALREKTENLEEVNAALRVLLRQREEDRKELGESVVANVRNLILPYTEKLKQSPLSSAQMTWMKILESHINEITYSFSRTLSAQYTNLTSTEIGIATLVRDGRSTAQIAEVLGISEKTVCRHRDNIRKKLGLRGWGINLRTHLLNLQ